MSTPHRMQSPLNPIPPSEQDSVGHAPVATAVGDLIMVQFTTQTEDTLANVKAVIIETN